MKKVIFEIKRIVTYNSSVMLPPYYKSSQFREVASHCYCYNPFTPWPAGSCSAWSLFCIKDQRLYMYSYVNCSVHREAERPIHIQAVQLVFTTRYFCSYINTHAHWCCCEEVQSFIQQYTLPICW